MRTCWILLCLFSQVGLAQITLRYVPELDDALDTGAVLVRSTQPRNVLLVQMKTWLAKEFGGTWRDTTSREGSFVRGRPVMKLPDWVIASRKLVQKRTLEFDLTAWFDGDSLKCAMSHLTYSYKKGDDVRSVPLTDRYREDHLKNVSRSERGKEPKPKHDELADMDRSLSQLMNRLANALGDQ